MWMLNGAFHAWVALYIPLLAMQGVHFHVDGYDTDLWSLSATSFTSIMLIVAIKLVLHTRYNT